MARAGSCAGDDAGGRPGVLGGRAVVRVPRRTGCRRDGLTPDAPVWAGIARGHAPWAPVIMRRRC